MKRLVLLLAAFYVPLAGAAFKCVDEKGLTHIGDTPPAGCANVVMYEVNRNGMIVRRIDPTPTPEQVKVKQDEADRKRAADKAVSEQRRKDLALLNTFSGEREFDVVRDRNIEPIRGRIASAQERIKAIEAREAKINEEMEFYKAGKRKTSGKAERDEPPPMLVTELERLTHEKLTLTTSIAASEKEIEQVRDKFDADKKRWVDIKTGVVPTPRENVPDAKAARKSGY